MQTNKTIGLIGVIGVIYSRMQVECTALPDKDTQLFNCKINRINRSNKWQKVEKNLRKPVLSRVKTT